MSPARYRQAFTMIELVITLCLIVLIMGIGLPSLTGQSHMRRLQGAFDRFDAFVVNAQQQSVRDGKPYVLAWTSKGAVRLLAATKPLMMTGRRSRPLRRFCRNPAGSTLPWCGVLPWCPSRIHAGRSGRREIANRSRFATSRRRGPGSPLTTRFPGEARSTR